MSRYTVFAAFIAGVFLGRFVSTAFGSGPLVQAVDLGIAAGVALIVVLGWRGWARRMIQQRRREQARRRKGRPG